MNTNDFTPRAELTLYEMLGVDEDATAEAIEAAYRFLAVIYHPDRAKTRMSGDGGRRADPWPARIFPLINSAHSTLRNPIKRSQYDNYLKRRRHEARISREEAAKKRAEATTPANSPWPEGSKGIRPKPGATAPAQDKPDLFGAVANSGIVDALMPEASKMLHKGLDGLLERVNKWRNRRKKNQSSSGN